MPVPLLETKLFVPRPRPNVVARPRLAALLDRGASATLTLVSGPPGFGKTTLLADWLAGPGADRFAKAWLSLDAADNDAAAFWAYVVAALDAASPGIRAAASPLVEVAAAPGPAALAPLLNALGDAPGDILLVLDDYHVIDRREIHDGLAYLLDHRPDTLHVVLATRADPPLPLARLRARGELVEVRAADLRFTPDEASTYLNDAMDLALTPRDIGALEDRTEGWIAALQLAALSMAGRTDRSSFIATFAGDDRYVVDYLAEEVLDRQPARVRQFLLLTSILDRLTAALCDAVTGDRDGRATLDSLERANLFLVALDDRRRWYRYHHLFGDVVRTRLFDESPDLVAELHRRASAWFEREGDEAGAIEHATAAGDVERAADLIELAAHDLRASRQERTLRRWLDALPDEVFDTRPVLAIAHVGALLATGETDRVEDRLAAAERWVVPAGDERARADAVEAGMVVRHASAFGHLASAIALYRAGLARMAGDEAATIAQAEAALDAAGPDQPLERGGAAGMLALARWTAGDLDGGFAAWADAATSLEAAGHRADVLGTTIAMADIRVAQGRLTDAGRILERGLRLGTPTDGPVLRGTVDMHVGLAGVDVERDDLAAARRHLDAARALGEGAGLPQSPYRLLVMEARIAAAAGHLDAALDRLDEAERRYDGDFFPDVRPIAAMRARVLVAGGRLAEARAWAGEAQVSPDDALAYRREYEHATLARLLLAEGTRDRDPRAVETAIGLAERLAASATDGGRHGSALDAIVVLAVARHARGDLAGAAAALDRAIALAEPDGWIRVFLEEGEPMTALLDGLGSRAGGPVFLVRLRGAARAAPGRPVAGASPVEPRGEAPAEPLSQRELDVLRLLRGELDGPDIARELQVSLNTLRTHTKSVYAKLGVNSRRAAVRRADELGLFR